ncbi:MAG TPA: hypothetical protein DCY74_08705 [Clostridiales bacterium]|jgi:hypothetical protein|nr:hypothetical protein [Clostridiales bacterium]
MLHFKSIQNTDFTPIAPFIRLKQSRLCDATFGALYFWKNYYETKYAIRDHHLYFSSVILDGTKTFTFPLGLPPYDEALTQLEGYCQQKNIPLIFYPAETLVRPYLEKRYGKNMIWTPWRDAFDYVYDKDAFVSMTGRKYHGQRNHINKFNFLYPNHRFTPICDNTIEAVRAFYIRYAAENIKKDKTAKAEHESILAWLEEYRLCHMFGGCLWVGDRVVGFSVGEHLGDTLHVHIEKADYSYTGAYPKLANSFASYFSTPQTHYINRQDDLGDAGLRRSKLSYRPVFLLEKYTVRVL